MFVCVWLAGLGGSIKEIVSVWNSELYITSAKQSVFVI